MRDQASPKSCQRPPFSSCCQSVWPNFRCATLFHNVPSLDVFLVMIGWPVSSPDESSAEDRVKMTGQSGRCPQTDCKTPCFGFASIIAAILRRRCKQA